MAEHVDLLKTFNRKLMEIIIEHKLSALVESMRKMCESISTAIPLPSAAAAAAEREEAVPTTPRRPSTPIYYDDSGDDTW
jgi:hypothetical protein